MPDGYERPLTRPEQGMDIGLVVAEPRGKLLCADREFPAFRSLAIP